MPALIYGGFGIYWCLLTDCDLPKAGGKYRGAVPPAGVNWRRSLAINGTWGDLHRLLRTPIADQN